MKFQAELVVTKQRMSRLEIWGKRPIVKHVLPHVAMPMGVAVSRGYSLIVGALIPENIRAESPVE